MVGFLSIFCTNQPVGIGLVDSWTSPRGIEIDMKRHGSHSTPST